MRMAGKGRGSGEAAGSIRRYLDPCPLAGRNGSSNLVAAAMSLPQVAQAKKRLIATVARLENWSTSCKQTAYRKSNRNKYRSLRSTERGREERVQPRGIIRDL